MTNPPTLWETVTRELQRFGHVSWLRRALEWCGVARRRHYLVRDGDGFIWMELSEDEVRWLEDRARKERGE